MKLNEYQINAGFNLQDTGKGYQLGLIRKGFGVATSLTYYQVSKLRYSFELDDHCCFLSNQIGKALKEAAND